MLAFNLETQLEAVLLAQLALVIDIDQRPFAELSCFHNTRLGILVFAEIGDHIDLLFVFFGEISELEFLDILHILVGKIDGLGFEGES